MGGVLGTQATIATVAAVAGACDIVREDTGLIAAIVVGLGLANLPGFDIPARRPFFETVIQLIIGVLFISISATVTPASLKGLVLPTSLGAADPVAQRLGRDAEPLGDRADRRPL